jgi:GT2 family glycosyltransferase
MSLPHGSSGPAEGVPVVDVVVVAYGAEPQLERCLSSVLASEGVEVRIALVDNGCSNPDLARLTDRPEVTLVRPVRNIGFAGGCVVGAAALDGEHVALVNSDAYVDPNTLSSLVGALVDGVGLTTACVLLAEEPDVVNSAGNPVHYLGGSWAGGLGESVRLHQVPQDVASASGAGCALRRELWERLGGFDPEFFLYCEDLDLSLRVWQQGLRVRYLPTAKVWHHYEFSRNERKWYFLERNRLLTLVTVLAGRTLALLAPALLVFELVSITRAAAARQLRGKFEGYVWLIRHHRHVRDRRAAVQRLRKVPDAVLVPVLSGTIDTPLFTGPVLAVGNAVLGGYWRLVRRWV